MRKRRRGAHSREQGIADILSRRLVDALTAPIITNLEAQIQRRTEAINAIMTYCAIEEPPFSRLIDERVPPAPRELELSQEERIAQWRRAVCVSKKGQRLRKCFLCTGKAITLPPDDPNLNKYCNEYFSHAEAVRHFKRTHLNKIHPDAQGQCPVCVPSVLFLDKEDLQNHANVVHGLRT